MYGVLSLRSHRVPSVGALYRFLPAWLRRTAAAALTLGTIGALGAILTVMAEDPGVRVPVIMYHAVMDDASRLGKYVISPEELESDFKWLSENGYTAVLSEDLINYTENGAALPEKPILLTFDDGYYNNYLYAYPTAKRYGMKFVLSPIENTPTSTPKRRTKARTMRTAHGICCAKCSLPAWWKLRTTRMTCTARTVRGSAQSSFPGNLWKTTRSFSPKT